MQGDKGSNLVRVSSINSLFTQSLNEMNKTLALPLSYNLTSHIKRMCRSLSSQEARKHISHYSKRPLTCPSFVFNES